MYLILRIDYGFPGFYVDHDKLPLWHLDNGLFLLGIREVNRDRIADLDDGIDKLHTVSGAKQWRDLVELRLEKSSEAVPFASTIWVHVTRSTVRRKSGFQHRIRLEAFQKNRNGI